MPYTISQLSELLHTRQFQSLQSSQADSDLGVPMPGELVLNRQCPCVARPSRRVLEIVLDREPEGPLEQTTHTVLFDA